MTDNKKKSSPEIKIKIPGYQIKRVLGKGGMAFVYLAVQESFGRDVAIKVLSAQMAQDKEFSARFIREAQIVSRLQHPNIVTVYDVGIHDEFHYLSMEYIPGKELREAKYDLSKVEIIRITKDVARALEYAHQQGYIHRDVKPENIMLHENGERVVLMDFGIARITQADNSVTKTGKVIGTPHYMSPEQNKGLTVDHRADIYSLGVVLFQMLAGRLPYDADSPVAVGIKHISDPIPTMPPGLEIFQPIINTCMSKSPEHRYATAADLITALDALNIKAIEAIDARVSVRRDTAGAINDPIRATAIGSATTADGLVMNAKSSRSISGSQFNIPPLVHPHPKKYHSYEREEKQKSKIGFIFLLLILGGSVWAYLNQPIVSNFWQENIQPTVLPLVIKYKLLPEVKEPAPVKSVETIKEPITASELKVADGEVVTPVVTEKNNQQTVTVNDAAIVQVTAKDIEQLKAELQQHPENAVELASNYKNRLKTKPGDLAARNGLSELREWYKHELSLAVDNNDLLRARLLVNQIQTSFPKLAEKPRYQRMITLLAQAETIQLHLDNAARHLTAQALIEPQGANALAEYKIVMALAPKHPEAMLGMKKIRDMAYKKAKGHEVKGELKKALYFVDAGLMAAIDDKELTAMKEKMGSKVERTNRHETLNKQAEVLFRSGNMVVPEGQSAFDKYSEVLKENPNNLVARSGVRQIEKHLVEYAIIYLEENDLEKSAGILKAAKEKFGATPIIEEVQFKLDKAIQSSSPKVTQVLFSAVKPATFSGMTNQKLKLNKILYVGFSYENLKGTNTVIQANLTDNTGRVLITSKRVTVGEINGETIFYMTLPTTRLANGSYKLELIMGVNKLTVGSFINDNTLPDL